MALLLEAEQEGECEEEEEIIIYYMHMTITSLLQKCIKLKYV